MVFGIIGGYKLIQNKTVCVNASSEQDDGDQTRKQVHILLIWEINSQVLAAARNPNESWYDYNH